MRAILLALALTLAPLLAAPGAGQSPVPTWRIGLQAARGTNLSTYRLGDDHQGMTALGVTLERGLGERYAVGLGWSGAWYEDRFGDQQRHALLVTGVARVWRGLRVSMGVGPGTASRVDVEGPPEGGFGDVVVSYSEGDPAVAWAAGVAWALPLGPFDLQPSAGVTTHHGRGEALSYWTVGLGLGLGAGR